MRRAPLILIACAVLLAGCSSSVDSAELVAATTTADPRGGIPPGYPVDVDVIAPLVITTVAPEPIPVTGTDGKVHVAYELEVLNLAPRPAIITQVETLAGGPEGPVVASLSQDQVQARTFPLANFNGAPATEIPVGQTAVLVLDGVYDTRADVPAEVIHRLSATYGAFTSDAPGLTARYPDNATQIGGAVTTSTREPVVISPPLAGDGWAAVNACCAITSHRGAMMGVGGRLSGTERYAIDWLRMDVDSPVLSSSRGDGVSNADYYAYDAPLLAVADGTVVGVVSDKQEEPPHEVNPNLTFDQLGGNYVIIDIGDGNYAFYAHLIPGSTTVKVGDTVSRGQEIGKLGNSGNTTEVHLHFHITRAPTPLSGDNVPYEIDRLTFVGSGATGTLVLGPNAGERTNQLPLNDDVINFPAAP